MATVSSWHYVRGRSSNMSHQYYKESVEQASSYNSRLGLERRLRLPFIDSQTGVAQSHTNLWMPYRYRDVGSRAGQLYTYPAKRWKKKKRSIPFDDDVKISKAGEIETGEAADMHQISAIENPAVKLDSIEPRDDIVSESSKDRWYDEIENLSEPLDAGEIEERNSDSSDFEETYVKKKKKKTKKGGGRPRKSDRYKVDDMEEKPYGCDTCGARYKTRPGLTYHLTHFHNRWEDEDEATPSPSPKLPTQSQSNESFSMAEGSGRPPKRKASANGKVNPNNYCDFCLGDEVENKKTGNKEDLVSCADCGRSGHPSCLQFTPNMIISVKKYPWQCIECKSCGLCGTSDNDDQLLFCDDCDRGYHMYCLNPPLQEPPEGSWSCHLCIEEFYGGKKPDSMI